MVQYRTYTGLGTGGFRLSGKQYLKMNVSSWLHVKFYCVLAGKNSPDCVFLAGLMWSMMCLSIFAKHTEHYPWEEPGKCRSAADLSCPVTEGKLWKGMGVAWGGCNRRTESEGQLSSLICDSSVENVSPLPMQNVFWRVPCRQELDQRTFQWKLIFTEFRCKCLSAGLITTTYLFWKIGREGNRQDRN